MFLNRVLVSPRQVPSPHFLKCGSEGAVELVEAASMCHCFSSRLGGFSAEVLLEEGGKVAGKDLFSHHLVAQAV